MTRNLDLGANLRTLIDASDVNQAVDLAGQAVNHAHASRFPSVRAALITKEIRKMAPDVVGLQEVSLYRAAPVNLSAVVNRSATQLDPLGGDFLSDLLSHLDKGKKKNSVRYRVVVVKPEFDAEFPVNDDGQGSGLAGADHNERLTYGAVILARKGVGLKLSKPTSGTFNSLLRRGSLSSPASAGETRPPTRPRSPAASRELARSRNVSMRRTLASSKE